jgi:sterol desaturase/sphingolipid hydroxylase (fatty acid hydroxylase superfamily)
MITLEYMFYSLVSFWGVYFIGAYLWDTDDVITRPKAEITKEKVYRRLFGNVCASILFLPIIPHIPELIVYNNVIVKYVCTAFLAETWFHFSHRLLHTKYLYFLHRDHHAYIKASALSGLYCSFFEMIFVNLCSVILPLAIAGGSFSFYEVVIIFDLLALNVLTGHAQLHRTVWSNYSLKVFVDNSAHEIHHKYMTGNFGSMLIYDRLLGTYQSEPEESLIA